MTTPTIQHNSFQELKDYFDDVLNTDKRTYTSSNDECTPLDCVLEMINKLPEELWKRKNLTVLDPCCGNGNFHLGIYFKLLESGKSKTNICKSLFFNDTNLQRLKNVRQIFGKSFVITSLDFLTTEFPKQYDLIVANPPYAKIMENGKRASKNHNLIKLFIEKSLTLLKPNGYLLFITPDNWMSLSDRNSLITTLTRLQIIHLDIHRAKKYFKKIGSSFTWFVIQNCPAYTDISVSGVYKNFEYTDRVVSQPRNFIPLFYNSTVQSILSKTIEANLEKFKIETSSDLHRYTKAKLIHTEKTNEFPYELVHTPKQTVWSSRPHKWQNGFKVFISLTDKYSVFIKNNVGMTQSIAFIRCENELQAKRFESILKHPIYQFLNNITRYGNFNCVRILQQFPIPSLDDIYESFGIDAYEREYIQRFL